MIHDRVRSFVITRHDGSQHEVLYDAECEQLLARYQWRISTKGYVVASSTGEKPRRLILMHRYLLGLGRYQGDDVDHINGIKTDNRRSNLRVVAHAFNNANRAIHTRGTSRFRGVSWIERDQRWRAEARTPGERHYIGSFRTEEEAGKAIAAWRVERGLPAGY